MIKPDDTFLAGKADILDRLSTIEATLDAWYRSHDNTNPCPPAVQQLKLDAAAYYDELKRRVLL